MNDSRAPAAPRSLAPSSLSTLADNNRLMRDLGWGENRPSPESERRRRRSGKGPGGGGPGGSTFLTALILLGVVALLVAVRVSVDFDETGTALRLIYGLLVIAGAVIVLAARAFATRVIGLALVLAGVALLLV